MRIVSSLSSGFGHAHSESTSLWCSHNYSLQILWNRDATPRNTYMLHTHVRRQIYIIHVAVGEMTIILNTWQMTMTMTMGLGPPATSIPTGPSPQSRKLTNSDDNMAIRIQPAGVSRYVSTADSGHSKERTTSLQWTNCVPPANNCMHVRTSEEGTTSE